MTARALSPSGADPALIAAVVDLLLGRYAHHRGHWRCSVSGRRIHRWAILNGLHDALQCDVAIFYLSQHFPSRRLEGDGSYRLWRDCDATLRWLQASPDLQYTPGPKAPRQLLVPYATVARWAADCLLADDSGSVTLTHADAWISWQAWRAVQPASVPVCDAAYLQARLTRHFGRAYGSPEGRGRIGWRLRHDPASADFDRDLWLDMQECPA